MKSSAELSKVSTGDPRTVRIYLGYDSLRLADFRMILTDFESAYNKLNRPENYPRGVQFRHTPLTVEQVHTGNSIELLLFGDATVVSLIVQVLSLLASHGLGTATAVGGAALAGIKARKVFHEGTKAKWEGEKVKQESIRIARENNIASIPFASAVPAAPEIVPNYRRDLPTASLQAAAEKLTTRIRRVRSSSRIKRMEITADGHKFVVTDSHEHTMLEEIPIDRQNGRLDE